MKIKDLQIRQIFDSRGDPTLSVLIQTETGGSYSAEVPSGKSRGRREAAAPDFEKISRVFPKIRAKLKGKIFRSIAGFDRILLHFDPTANKRILGGNLSLGLSAGFTRAFAGSRSLEIWQVLESEFFTRRTDGSLRPWIFSNFINGGLHCRNCLAFQEYQIVARSGRQSLLHTTETLVRLYRLARERIVRITGQTEVPVGDESGFSADFPDNFAPLKFLQTLIVREKLQDDFSLGLDLAANSYFQNGQYILGGKSYEPWAYANFLAQKTSRFPLLQALEDPFTESDEDGFGALRNKLADCLIIGDDLTVTNPRFIVRAARLGLVNAVIIKPNQIGTVSETCAAVRSAEENKLKVIVSHRSGETADNFIIQLARASRAFGLKIGAPAHERIFKFNEMLKVYDT